MTKKLTISEPNDLNHVGVIAQYRIRETYYCFFEMDADKVENMVEEWNNASTPAEFTAIYEKYNLN